MKIDLEALVRQVVRWGAMPHENSSKEMAHRLLEKLPADQRVHVFLEWGKSDEWQFVFDGKLVTAGSFEHCVTTFAAMFCPQREVHQ